MVSVFQVVSGPMDVVRSIDRMAASLSPRLMETEQHVLIQSPNISESHTQKQASLNAHIHTHARKRC